MNFNLPYPNEQLWAAYSSFAILPPIEVTASVIDHKTVGQNTGKFISGFLAGIHTHPNGANPVPGPADYHQKIPIYGISSTSVWVLSPIGIKEPGMIGVMEPVLGS